MAGWFSRLINFFSPPTVTHVEAIHLPEAVDWSPYLDMEYSDDHDINTDIASLRKHWENLGASWMTQLLPYVGERSLETICVPASHDAGMSQLSRKVGLGTNSSTVTQTLGILGQLNCGIRKFDLRPSIYKDKFWCGHYHFVPNQSLPSIVASISGVYNRYHGGEGVSIDSFIDDLNTFTASHNEVILVGLKAMFNWDREIPGREWDHLMNQDEWNRLLKEMQRINHLYEVSDGANSAVAKVRITDLIGKGCAAVIVVADMPNHVIISPEFAGKGIFYWPNFWEENRTRWVTHTQDSLDAICAFLADTNQWQLLWMVVKWSGADRPYLQKKLWSVTSVADYRQREDLPKELDRFFPSDYPTSVAMDNIHDQELLSLVLRGTARMLFGKDTYLKFENGKWQYEVPA